MVDPSPRPSGRALASELIDAVDANRFASARPVYRMNGKITLVFLCEADPKQQHREGGGHVAVMLMVMSWWW